MHLLSCTPYPHSQVSVTTVDPSLSSTVTLSLWQRHCSGRYWRNTDSGTQLCSLRIPCGICGGHKRHWNRLLSLTLSQFFFLTVRQPQLAWASFVRFLITLRHTTLGRTPLEEWSDRRGDLYLKTYITHNRQTSMPPAGFEPTIPASKRL